MANEKSQYVVGDPLPDHLWVAWYQKRLKAARCVKCKSPVVMKRKVEKEEKAICKYCSEALLRGWDPDLMDGWAGWEIDKKHDRLVRPFFLKPLPKGSHTRKGTWYAVLDSENPFDSKSPVVRVVYVACPDCGQSFALDRHGIKKDGHVNPSVVCPFDKCSYHEFVVLGGWDGSEQEEKHEWGKWKGQEHAQWHHPHDMNGHGDYWG